MDQFGKSLIVVGVVIVALGAAVWLASRLGLPVLGKLPGDFTFRIGGATVYIPLATCILLSAIGSGILWLIWRLGR